MTNQCTKNCESLREALAAIALRHLEYYFGDKVVLGLYARICWAAAGSFTMLAFQFAWQPTDPVLAWFSAVQEPGSPEWVMFLIFTISPLLLAFVVGQSVQFGRPLRFFLMGFFVYGLLLTFAELPPPSPNLDPG